MKAFFCDDCEGRLTKESKNKVTVRNQFNHAYRLHYCAACALKRFPELRSMIGWTKPSI